MSLKSYIYNGFCGLVALGSTFSTQSIAAESTASFYVPGLYGDAAVAVPPAPGSYLLATSIFFPAKAPHSIFPGKIDQKVETEAYAHFLRGFWVPDEKFFGLQILMGVRLSVLNLDISAELNTPIGSLILEDSKTAMGDLGLIPMSLYWQRGNLYLNLYEAVNIPTAKYDKTRLANTSLNHWVFDTVLAATWLDPGTGIEISASPGVIYNTENTTTNYKSGVEFHMDLAFNLHLSSSLAVGMHGSVYRQLTGDEGAGAIQGSFKGRSNAIGPAIVWNKKLDQKQYYLSAKWLHEFSARNRLEGNLYSLTGGIKF